VLGSTTIVTSTVPSKPGDKPSDKKDTPEVAGRTQTQSEPAPAAGVIAGNDVSYAG